MNKILHYFTVMILFISMGFCTSQDWPELERKMYLYDSGMAQLLTEAENHYEKKEYKQAINTSTEAINIDSTLWKAYFIRGESYGFIGEFKNALKDYSRVINLNSDTTHYILSLYQRATTQMALGIRAKYICKDLKIVGEQVAKHTDLQYLKENGYILFEICSTVEETEDITELLNFGTFLASKGYLIEAIPIFNEVVYSDSTRDRAYNNLANCYYDLGKKEQALPYLLKTIEINPENEQALQTLSDYYYNIDLELSLKYARKSAQLGNKSIQQWLEKNGYEW